MPKIARTVARLAPLVILALSACQSYKFNPNPASPAGESTAFAGKATDLAALLGGSVISKDEEGMRDLLLRVPVLTFPIKLGLAFLDYSDPLKAEDQAALTDAVGKDLVASGLAREMLRLPTTFVTRGMSLDDVRKLGARFQLDVVLIVSGRNTLTTLPAPQPGLFDFSTPQQTFESRTTLTALALTNFTGTMLAPFQVAGYAGPETVDPGDAAAYEGKVYALRQKAQTQALTSLAAKVKASLQDLKDHPPSPRPSPSPSPTPEPSPSPSPTPSPSPSPEASR